MRNEFFDQLTFLIFGTSVLNMDMPQNASKNIFDWLADWARFA